MEKSAKESVLIFVGIVFLLAAIVFSIGRAVRSANISDTKYKTEKKERYMDCLEKTDGKNEWCFDKIINNN